LTIKDSFCGKKSIVFLKSYKNWDISSTNNSDWNSLRISLGVPLLTGFDPYIVIQNGSTAATMTFYWEAKGN
jgi:hypothetical protein